MHLTQPFGLTAEAFPCRRLVNFHAKCSVRRYPEYEGAPQLKEMLGLQSESEGALDPLEHEELRKELDKLNALEGEEA